MSLLRKYGWLLLIPAIAAFIYYFPSENNEAALGEHKVAEETKEASFEEMPHDKGEQWMVDVKGEVSRPGIYEMEQGTRVNDAVNKAGGFTDTADRNSVNLAQKLQDEMVILVLSIDQQSSGGAEASSDKVAVNRATPEEIQKLPGIGPSKAEAIVQYRDDTGGFQSIEDLLEVPGIGEKTLEQMKEMIQIP
ncbi:ComEA family DNA-binding protein [Halobacillus sp. Marseille-Q1614]|uniref:ComEA family DNA-binding protein n=1 Tax=Halobacillus sp. Marseille-Q1614 TaxID=2709134 RepID=UPI00157032CE|nr:ComEA family DNA-binding protein [Halobacillus sp. Marseille-Q1614]